MIRVLRVNALIRNGSFPHCPLVCVGCTPEAEQLIGWSWVKPVEHQPTEQQSSQNQVTKGVGAERRKNFKGGARAATAHATNSGLMSLQTFCMSPHHRRHDPCHHNQHHHPMGTARIPITTIIASIARVKSSGCSASKARLLPCEGFFPKIARPSLMDSCRSFLTILKKCGPTGVSN